MLTFHHYLDIKEVLPHHGEGEAAGHHGQQVLDDHSGEGERHRGALTAGDTLQNLERGDKGVNDF